MKKLFLFLSLLIGLVSQAQFTNSYYGKLGVFSSIGNYDANAQAFFTALESDASPTFLSTSQKNSVNTLVTSLKAYSLWVKYTAIYLNIGGTASAHKYNLKDPRDLDAAYRITWPNGATHSSGGVDYNGTNQYGNTHITFAVPANESAFWGSIYSREDNDSWTALFGFNGSNGKFIPKSGGQLGSDVPDAANELLIATAYNTAAHFGVSLGASRLHTVYYNGSSIGNRTNGAVTYSSTILLSANSTNADFPSPRQQAWAAFALSAFSATDASNEYSVVTTFETSNGRNN